MRWLLWLQVVVMCGLCVSPVASCGLPRARAALPNWQLVEDDEGIKVWSLEIPGRDLPGFRGITTIRASVDEIVKFLLDTSQHTDWMYNCDESRVVKTYSDAHHVLYNRINAPWPVRDRDVLLDVVWRFTPQHNAVTFRFRTTNDFQLPTPEHVIRIPRLEGFYRLWQEVPGRTNVLYQVEVDIGGNVPDRQARRYARNLPFETLDRLREKVEAPQHGG